MSVGSGGAPFRLGARPTLRVARGGVRLVPGGFVDEDAEGLTRPRLPAA